MTDSPWHNPDLLRRLYWEEGMTTREISDEIGCVNSTVVKSMDKYGIESLSSGEAQQDPPCGKDEMERLYHEEGLTQYELSEKFGCSQSSIQRWIHRYRIETTYRKTAATFFTGKDGYEKWANHTPGVGTTEIPVHRLLAVSEYGFEAVCGKDVHHINLAKWDNRPDNIQILTPSAHRKLHENHQTDPETGLPAGGSE